MTRAAGWYHPPEPPSYDLASDALNLDWSAAAPAPAAPEMPFTEHVGKALMPSQQLMMAAN